MPSVASFASRSAAKIIESMPVYAYERALEGSFCTTGAAAVGTASMSAGAGAMAAGASVVA
eukprot:7351336-Prymnesium_polylepis.1